MFILTETSDSIVLLLDGACAAMIAKNDVEDFTTTVIGNNRLIDFDTKSSRQVRFAIPNGKQSDLAIEALIKITDEMGI
tara:strand:+ start:356 stop:592 length:237 start_codon:yes stop_codon:yes gene_type:complete